MGSVDLTAGATENGSAATGARRRLVWLALALTLAGLVGGVLMIGLNAGRTASSPDPILPGIDLWMTTAGGTAYWDFSAAPLPADFFGPGSDPFDGRIYLKGTPLPNLLSPPSIHPADTVVERLGPASLPAVGTSDTISIEIRALSLVSIAPIQVTYSGINPEPWQVEVMLSSSLSQTVGRMTINHDCTAGGTFSATLPVQPRFIFTRLSDSVVREHDNTDLARTLTVPNGRWVHTPSPVFSVTTALPGAVTDGDGDGVWDDPLPPTSDNFAAGLWPVPCMGVEPSPFQWMRLTQFTATHAALGVIIANNRPFVDVDLDWMPNIADNCRTDSNPLQLDSDDNGFGNVCQRDVYLPLTARDY
jgi:hypothetical protein